MKQLNFAILAILTLFMNTNFVLSDETKTISIDCWAGGPETMPCGILPEPGNYDCSGGAGRWTPTCTFQDPVPTGCVVTKIDAVVFLWQCGPACSMWTLVNAVGLGSPDGTTIWSPACGGTTPCLQVGFPSQVYPAGFPAYRYGQRNTLQIATQDNSNYCVEHVEITITYRLLDVTIRASNPIIPDRSGIEGGHVLTQSDLAIEVKASDGNPVQGATVTLESDRGALDTITQPRQSTDASGKTDAQVETRNQPGTSTITSNTIGMRTVSPGIVDWLPAEYESEFTVTCYVTTDENYFLKSPLRSNYCGLPPTNQYHQAFMQDVRLQGSGRSLSGEILQYLNGCYRVSTCPQTASGACAVVGTTIAVDTGVIPMGSTVSIDGLGPRIAQDTGGDIRGNDIDVYLGFDRDACVQFGTKHASVQLTGY